MSLTYPGRTGVITYTDSSAAYTTTGHYISYLFRYYPSASNSKGTITYAVTATINRRKPVAISTTPSNVFDIVSSTSQLASFVELATGTLNWMAVGG
jgi:hypothetical protein